LKSAKQTTGIASINMTQLKKCPMLIPPIFLQNNYADRVKKIESQKQTMTTALKELENNFNSLMQRAFKGEI
jgi:type I restriction enzyme S subunit